MPYILTFDIGTTSVKTCLFNKDLSIISKSIEEYSLLTGPGNIVEFLPEAYFEAVKRGLQKIASRSQLEQIDAICISTQGETIIPVDRNGNALRNAVVWLDCRAGSEAEYISSLPIAKDIYHKTGIPAIDGAVPVSKLLWIKWHEPEIYEKTYKFLLLEDYIVFCLTGQFVTDRGIISSTAYYNIKEDVLYKELFDALDLDPQKIPKVNYCGDIIGKVTPQVSENLGINPETVVISGAMDQIASAVGAGNIKEGIVTETTGTCMVISTTTDVHSFEQANNVLVVNHVIPGKFLFIPMCITAGIVLKWFKDEFCTDQVAEAKKTGQDVYDILGTMADKVSPGSNGLTLVPYLNGVLQPENMPSMRGVFFGVSLDTKKPQFLRAIFEGIGFMLRENIDLIESKGIEVHEIRSFGGGSKSRIWQKIKSDISGKSIASMKEAECASLGVAILAACALKWYPNLEEACKKNNIKLTDNPNPKLHEFYVGRYQKYLEVCSATKNLF